MLGFGRCIGRNGALTRKEAVAVRRALDSLAVAPDEVASLFGRDQRACEPAIRNRNLKEMRPVRISLDVVDWRQNSQRLK